ncbi:nuclear transport factor 2 family protein [Winogradskyella sp.]|uniref:nuclear transport factor 2 family protein n=1 Tax=Winogradskyella sp. TaxID=1883156 RepID=UPI00262E61AA|nr:nuclear transport factor 2 family protein [Winogradskyella sp.]
MNYSKKIILIIFVSLTCSFVVAQSKKDSIAIKNTVKDFIEGWYEGDAKRMENSLHPDVVSKIVIRSDKGIRLGRFTAEKLVTLTRQGGGTDVPKEEQRKNIKILEIYQNMASARVLAYDAMEFLHLAKWEGEWKIMNILFERSKK